MFSQDMTTLIAYLYRIPDFTFPHGFTKTYNNIRNNKFYASHFRAWGIRWIRESSLKILAARSRVLASLSRLGVQMGYFLARRAMFMLLCCCCCYCCCCCCCCICCCWCWYWIRPSNQASRENKMNLSCKMNGEMEQALDLVRNVCSIWGGKRSIPISFLPDALEARMLRLGPLMLSEMQMWCDTKPSRLHRRLRTWLRFVLCLSIGDEGSN